jgi:VWFA-related protein
MRRFTLLIVFWICILQGSSLKLEGYCFPASDSSADMQQESRQEQVTVTMKLIQIYVTDKNGNVVPDLERSDFELFDNSKRTAIAAFEKYIDNESQPEDPSQGRTGIPLIPDRSKRKFFFLFDFAFSDRLGIEESKRETLHFMENYLQLGDETAIASYSVNNSLVIHADLTTDHRKCREILDQFMTINPAGKAKDVEEEYWGLNQRNKILISRWDEDRYRKELEIDRLIYLNQVRRFLEKMREWTRHLIQIPGHKHIVLFSGGIPSSIIYETQAASDRYSREDLSQGHVLWVEFEKMNKEMGASSTSIYAFDLGEMASVTRKSLSVRGSRSLKSLSEVTGGKYYPEADEFRENFRDINTITGSYYILGFYLDKQSDQEFHHLEVKLKRKGCRAHTALGYYKGF